MTEEKKQEKRTKQEKKQEKKQAQINAAVAKDDATAIENIVFTVSRPAPWNG